jgi:aquaporin Z
VVQLAGAICAALFLQLMFGDVAAGGNYPISKTGGDWRSLVMEIVLTTILVSVILNTATGSRSIGHNAAIAVGSTGCAAGVVRQPDQRRLHESPPARSARTSSVPTSPAGGCMSWAR